MIKTEHNGAKNGGGFYGPRVQAKEESNKLRRAADRRARFEAARDWVLEEYAETFKKLAESGD